MDPVPFSTLAIGATFRQVNGSGLRLIKRTDTTAEGWPAGGHRFDWDADALCIDVETEEQRDAAYKARREAERVAEVAKLDTFATKVRAIARCLRGSHETRRQSEDTYADRRPFWYQSVTLKDGGSLGFHFDAHKSRIEIKGELPHEGNDGRPYSAGACSASLTREARSIADDIIRKVLPEYGPALAKRRADDKARADQEAQRDGLAESIRVAASLGKGCVYKRDGRLTVESGDWDAAVWSDCATFTVRNLKPEHAAKLARFLAKTLSD